MIGLRVADRNALCGLRVGRPPVAWCLISSFQETSQKPGKTGVSEALAPKLAPPPPNDPELEQIIAAWSTLPAAVKQAILLLVGNTAR
jgi:hypothetical protein